MGSSRFQWHIRTDHASILVQIPNIKQSQNHHLKGLLSTRKFWGLWATKPLPVLSLVLCHSKFGYQENEQFLNLIIESCLVFQPANFGVHDYWPQLGMIIQVGMAPSIVAMSKFGIHTRWDSRSVGDDVRGDAHCPHLLYQLNGLKGGRKNQLWGSLFWGRHLMLRRDPRPLFDSADLWKRWWLSSM